MTIHNGRRWTSMPSSMRWAIAGMILVLITLLGSATTLVYQEYKDQENQALKQAENLSLLLERNLESILEQVDVTLRSVVREAEEEVERGRFDGKYLNDLLAYHQSFMPHVLSLRITDAEGTVRFGNDVTNGQVNLAERGFFRQLQSGPAKSGTVIDGPVLAKISKQWVIVLARRINRPDGGFAGVVYANIATDHLSKIFSDMNLGRYGAVSLRTSDLRMIARFPQSKDGPNIIGTSNVSSQLTKAIEASPLVGTYIAKTAIDGVERANSYRKIASFPLMVLVGLGTEDYLSKWRQHVFVMLALAAVVVVLTLFSGWLFFRTWATQKSQKALIQDNEERLRLALSAACMDVFEFDAVSKISINESDGNIGRGLPRQFTVDDYMARIHPDDLPAFQQALADIRLEHPTYKHPYRFRMPDGSYRWLMDQGQASFDEWGQLIRVLGVCWDISAQKRAEETILAQNEALEQRVEERTAELVTINQDLEGFTYAASHDLKGPLVRINTFSKLLEDQYRDRLDGDGLLFIEFIRQNATRLVQLVDDLLGHARIAKQALELKPVDALTRGFVVLEERAEDIRDANADVRINIPPVRALADAQALTQALSNLVQNALKYSATSNPPIIEIGGEVRGTKLVLWVRDNGIGFDMAYHDRIFEIFRRLHTHNEYEGSGIGLALVKRAMERMGGRVWADSQPGQGSTFFLELQLANTELLAVA